MTRIVVLGDAAVALVSSVPAELTQGVVNTSRNTMSIGGDGAVLAGWMARNRHQVQLAACVGNDPMGQFIRSQTQRLGVKADLLQTNSVARTGTLAIVTEVSGARTTLLDVGANSSLALTPDLATAIEQADVLVLSTSLYLRPENRDLALEILDIARATDTVLIVDAADAQGIHAAGAQNVRRFLDQVDIVVANDEEIAALTSDQPAGWLGSLPNVVITHRAGGASWWSNGTPVARKSASPIAVVDTVGAGAAFLAGIVVVLSDTGEFLDISKATKLRALELGVSVAATCCSQEGPWPR